MPYRGQERRQFGGLTDEQLERIAEHVADRLAHHEGEGSLCDHLAERLEARLFEWVGRKFSQWLLLLVGAAGAGTWLFVHYLKTQGVI